MAISWGNIRQRVADQSPKNGELNQRLRERERVHGEERSLSVNPVKDSHNLEYTPSVTWILCL